MADTSGAAGTPSADSLDREVMLHASMRGIAGLVTGAQSLDVLLERMASFAVQAVPGSDGAGATLLHPDRSHARVEAAAASHPFVGEIDDIQYRALDEGPCVTAARDATTVRSGTLGTETRWPRFGPVVAQLGVHSALALPLVVSGTQGDLVVGAIGVYARSKNAFDDHAVRLGEQFAEPAAVAAHNAQLLAQAQELTRQLQTAMLTRPTIDQAIGIIRGRTGVSAETALNRLRSMSQHDNVKLSEVAQQIVDEAVRRAQSRHEQA